MATGAAGTRGLDAPTDPVTQAPKHGHTPTHPAANATHPKRRKAGQGTPPPRAACKQDRRPDETRGTRTAPTAEREERRTHEAQPGPPPPAATGEHTTRATASGRR